MSDQFNFEQISVTDIELKKVANLATRPNMPSRYGEGNLTADQLKKRFDDLAIEVITKYNEMAKILSSQDVLKYLKLPDGVTLSGTTEQTVKSWLDKIVDVNGNLVAIDPSDDNVIKTLDSVLASLYAAFSDVEANEDIRKENEKKRDEAENGVWNENHTELITPGRVQNENERISQENTRQENEKKRDEAENGIYDSSGKLLVNGRVQSEAIRQANERNRKSVWIKYSASPDGTGATDSWTSGQDYIGIARSHDAPTSNSEYKWCLFKGEKGDKGDKGDPLQIVKSYPSVAEMNASYDDSDVAVGHLVAIDTGNVEDADNAKLYLKTSTGFMFVTDLSGTEGLRGPKGDKGDKGDTGDLGIIPYNVQEQILWVLGTNGSHGLEYKLFDEHAVCAGIGECTDTDIEIGSMVKGVPVTFIDYAAFKDCSNLTGVIIPDSVTDIGYEAFSGCTSLTSVTIGNSVPIIISRAFFGCTSLSSVVIPDSVTDIGYEAFSGCTSLTDVYYRGTKEEWNNLAIDHFSNEPLLKATIHYSYGG